MHKCFPFIGILFICLFVHFGLQAQSSVSVPSEYSTTKKERKVPVRQSLGLKIVYFGVDQSEINAKSKVVLDRLYEDIKNKENWNIKIDGHSNGSCDDEFCEKLANERAEAVAFYMMEKGLRSHRIMYAGYGKQKPRASNRTKDGKRKNQRVEIHIIKGS